MKTSKSFSLAEFKKFEAEYREFHKIYQEMLDKGLAKPRGYCLPDLAERMETMRKNVYGPRRFCL